MLEHTMNFELYIENLGAIEKAEMTINPLTILAGENGTGKSFVTKFLYSVLNVLMKDVHRNDFIKTINDIENNHLQLKDFLEQGLFSSFGMFLVRIRERFSHNYFDILTANFTQEKEEINNFSNQFKKLFDELKLKLETDFTNEYKNPFLGLLNRDSDFSKKSEDYVKYSKFYNLLNNNIILLNKLSINVENPLLHYFQTLRENIIYELKANFQISNIKQLIKKDKEILVFEIKEIIKIEIKENELNIIQHNAFNNIKSINRLVFFESPIYWRLSRDLIQNSNKPQTYYLSSEINDERLTGIPKFFFDLREVMFANFANNERPEFIEQCADDLQRHLNGKFNITNDDLSFETNQGQPIVKNLVSFGMTNLGIIQAVLSKNIINKGSFVFIDEPESNLHPEWQAVLADILVKLAENGVFVVITTHSSDMLKALDVISQEHKQLEDFTSVNYFEKGGILAELNADELSPIRLARSKLLDTYENLMMREYLL